MKPIHRFGLIATVLAFIIGGSVLAVAALGSPPAPSLPSQSPVTLQSRPGDESFTAPGPQDPATEPEVPSSSVPQPVEPPVQTYQAPPPYQYDDDWDDDDDDDDWDDDDDDDDWDDDDDDDDD